MPGFLEASMYFNIDQDAGHSCMPVGSKQVMRSEIELFALQMCLWHKIGNGNIKTQLPLPIMPPGIGMTRRHTFC